MSLQKLVIEEEAEYYEMQNLSKTKQSRVVHELLSDIEEKTRSLEGFFDYSLFKLREEGKNNYVTTVLERKNGISCVSTFFLFFARCIYSMSWRFGCNYCFS
jgi:hypothetical protein